MFSCFSTTPVLVVAVGVRVGMGAEAGNVQLTNNSRSGSKKLVKFLPLVFIKVSP